MAPTQARYWRRRGDDKVVCELCPHLCVIAPGGVGVCGVRQSKDGALFSLNYGLLSAIAVDPIEKKPLYHVDPGSSLLSLGSYGCNLKCEFCQNYGISQDLPVLSSWTPEQVVRLAVQQRQSHPNLTGIAYTYNEPTVWMEFVLDTARLAKREGFRNVLVTNGYIRGAALDDALEVTDAWNVDVKGWSSEFYRTAIHGRLEPVIEAVERVSGKAWLEVTYLVIPGENDGDGCVEGLSSWLAGLSPSIPLHLSRYFPAHRYTRPATPLSTLERLREVAAKHLRYVYIGNAWKPGYADTRCPNCNTTVIERGGLEIERSYLVDGVCPTCGRDVEMVGKMWLE